MLTFPSASLRPQTVLCGIGILADCPSRMRLRLRLGPDLPRVDERCPGNLRLSVLQFLTVVFATHTGILTSCRSTVPYKTASAQQERSSTTQPLLAASIASVPYFSPGNLRRRDSRPVSYYALFKWWLLLSQHPGCLGNPTSFST